MNLVFGILAAIAAVLFVFLVVPARALSIGITKGFPIILIVIGTGLTLMGRASIGSMIILVGVALWRRGSGVGTFGPSSSSKSNAPKKSAVRSAALEMELDHETGEMEGWILLGPYEGQLLDDLSLEDLSEFRDTIRQDSESLSLLDAYLDRRFPGWSENTHFDGAAGEVGSPAPGTMSKEEAYEVLGLEPGASAADIGKAHRRLMKRAHPDSGGSTFLAAKINEAKDVLLKSHS